jgi:hypothetical protein
MTISAAADGLFIDNQIGKTATPSPTGRPKLFVTVGADGALIYRKQESAVLSTRLGLGLLGERASAQ